VFRLTGRAGPRSGGIYTVFRWGTYRLWGGTPHFTLYPLSPRSAKLGRQMAVCHLISDRDGSMRIAGGMLMGKIALIVSLLVLLGAPMACHADLGGSTYTTAWGWQQFTGTGDAAN